MFSGIYVHIPFCLRKCPYCDFVSYGITAARPGPGRRDIAQYLTALLKEAQLYRQDYSLKTEQTLTSLYIGGGTPTCLSGGQLFLLIKSLRRMYQIKTGAEITVEANPGTLDAEKLRALAKCGCNRLSIGVQSFDHQELKILGRIYSIKEIQDSYGLARQAGFHNIGFDLMYGLPGQTPDRWRHTLETAVHLAPEHISVYQLKIEPGTPFFTRQEKGLFPEFEQDTARQMLEEAINILTLAGYRHYEISNFARPGFESRHNRIYWHNQEYLGLGAGAGGYLGQMRYRNESVLAAYQKAIQAGEKPVENREALDKPTAMAETMFLGLRLLEGVKKEEFFRKFGANITDIYGSVLEKLKKQGLLGESDTHIFLTREGLFLANLVFMAFLPD